MMETPNQDIKYLFEPQTIAVIGAARDPNKIGYNILTHIVRILGTVPHFKKTRQISLKNEEGKRNSVKGKGEYHSF